MDSYLRAITYVTYKFRGDSNTEAWSKTFPDRYARLLAKGTSKNHIAAHVSGYHASVLVNRIMAQAMIPSHILNQHHYQEGINKLVQLIRTSDNERIQMESAAKLVDALKAPEVKKVELDLGLENTTVIKDLREATLGLAQQQLQMLKSGTVSAQEVAHQPVIIEGEFHEEC